jgi:bifunctional NMN adenylyltransferase/nudix hydrolase
MEISMDNNSVGVVVARFQVPEMHAGHRYLLDEVTARHPLMLVILGLAPTWVASSRDPLDFETRKAMVLCAYPGALVVGLPDAKTDHDWSLALDTLVAKTCPERSAVLYGSRDSFIAHYRGGLKCIELPSMGGCNGTALREDAREHPCQTREFRAGAIYAASKRPPLVYQAVDIAVIDRDRKRILLGRKTMDGGTLRFIGGFVDTKDASLEAAAKREAIEEAPGIELADFRYLGSSIIDDWRYRNTQDRIMSALFVATYVFGHAQAGDDLDGLEWVSVEHLEEKLVEAHQPFAKLLITHFTNH